MVNHILKELDGIEFTTLCGKNSRKQKRLNAIYDFSLESLGGLVSALTGKICKKCSAKMQENRKTYSHSFTITNEGVKRD